MKTNAASKSDRRRRPPRGTHRSLVVLTVLLWLCVGGYTALFVGCSDALEDPLLPLEEKEDIQLDAGQLCRASAPPPGVFTESASTLGISFVHNAYPEPDPGDPDGSWVLEDFAGVGIGDLDGDGALDLVFGQGEGQPVAYLTGGRGPAAFAAREIDVLDPSRTITVGDIDGDGLADLVIVTKVEPVFLKGDGQGGFSKEQPILSSAGAEPSVFSVALGDLNGDTFLDAFLGNQQDFSDPSDPFTPGREYLLINQGGGTFVDASARIPTQTNEDLTFIAALVDLDDDGDLDVYEVNDSRPFEHLGLPSPGGDVVMTAGNRLLRNDSADGDVTLEDVSLGSGADVQIAGMGLAIGDYDNDGLLDLYVPTMLPDKNALLHNEGGLRFRDVTTESSTHTLNAAHDVGWGAVFFDADADGWLDLYVLHGFIQAADFQSRKNEDEQDNVLLRNAGDGSFVEEQNSGLTGSAWSRSPVVGDLNRDGFPDLVVGNADAAPYVYLNGCDDRPWMTVRLDGPPPNAAGIGARVRITAGEQVQTRHILAGSDGLYGTSAAEAYFGFAKDVEVVSIEVRWPGGKLSVWPDIPVRNLVTIRK